MIERELREIKRRFRPEKSNILRIVGCLVNSNKQIVSKISQSMDFSDSAASEKLLSVMKKVLSGSLGTNLNDIAFSTKDVTDSEEHKLLMKLRSTALEDEEALSKFYTKIIESVDLDSNYAILIANDRYDVFSRSSDGESSGSSEVFSYLVCAVCPVKNAPEALSFRESDSLFHIMDSSAILSAPEIGFMFPAFDDRATNIYGALYYTRSLTNSYPDFTRAIFNKAAHMPPKVQREAFGDCLIESLGDECSLEVVRSLQTQIEDMVASHKETKDPEPLTITKSTVKTVLAGCGIDEEKCEKAASAFEESLGTNAAISPKNVIPLNKFEIKAPDVSIKVGAESKNLVTVQTLNGQKYVMIRLTGSVELNGILLSEEKE